MPVDDKWIGLALAVSSSAAIGMSYIITKKGLNTAGKYGEAASDNLAYLRNPIWWAGISTLVLGEVANFAAYTFAPPILVTPLGALSVLIGAILASFLLNEELGHLGRVGCTLSLIGSLIIVLHAPEDKEVETVDEILEYAAQPGFLLYVFLVIVFSLVMIYVVAPRKGRTNPLVYVSICSLVGSVSVMAIKGFGVAVKLTFTGKNQFVRPSTYVFGVVSVFCILIQMNYLNKALDTFSVNIVNAMYYVGFSTATIVASLILFQGFNTTDTTNTVSLLCGFIVTFLGVHILNLSRLANNADTATLPPADPLSNRLSLDGWLEAGSPFSARTPRSARGLFGGVGHGRRSSTYRAQSLTLFSAFEVGHEDEEDGHRLHQLRDEHEYEHEHEWDGDDDADTDERTGLRKDRLQQHKQSSISSSRQTSGSRHGHGSSRSRSTSSSPLEHHASLGDANVRITPRQV